MKIQKEELNSSQVQLLVEVEDEMVQKAMRQAARTVGRSLNVPGFRKGKAPYQAVVRHVGEAAVLEEAIDGLLPTVLATALEEAEVEFYAPQHIEPHVEKVSPLTFRFVVPKPPTVRLAELGAVAIEMKEVKVEEEDVQRVLDDLREQHGTLEPSLGPAAYGDQLTVDLTGALMDGTDLDKQAGLEITLVEPEAPAEGEEGEPRPEPDLHSQMVGMMVNQVKEVAVSYPAEWPEERISGRTVLYKVTLLDLKKQHLPDLDDEFAMEVGDFDSLEALRDRIRENLEAEAEETEFARQIDEMVEQLATESEISYPDFLVEDEVARRLEGMEQQLRPYNISLDSYLEVVGQTREDLQNEHWESAEEYVRRSLVVTQYVLDNQVMVSEEEVERELDLLLATYDPSAAASLRARLHENEEDMSQMANRLLTRKALYQLHHEVTGLELQPLFPEVEEEEAVPVDEEFVEVEEMASFADEPAETVEPEGDTLREEVEEEGVIETAHAPEHDAYS